VTGDTRPPNCGETANYPTAIINAIVDQMKAKGAQFAIDAGDHIYVCNSDFSAATTQMNLYLQATARLGKTFFMTQGNHECYPTPCLPGSSSVNHRAYMQALAPISATPYYSFDVQTSGGLATFVIIADNSWDATQEAWLQQTLTTADSRAKYTIVVRHHPQSDSAVATNGAMMALIRTHKFALLLTGHSHYYRREAADNGRDLIVGIGGAPLVVAGAFYGYLMVEQQRTGRLQVSVYDLNTNTIVDSFSVGPNG